MLDKNALMACKKTNDFIKMIKSLGYYQDRARGSHMIYIGDNLPSLSIPNQTKIARGTLRNLVKLILGDAYYN